MVIPPPESPVTVPEMVKSKGFSSASLLTNERVPLSSDEHLWTERVKKFPVFRNSTKKMAYTASVVWICVHLFCASITPPDLTYRWVRTREECVATLHAS